MQATQAVQWRLNQSERATYTQIIKTVAATTTPERITSTQGTEFRQAVIMGKKAARTDNTSTCYIGLAATDSSQPYAVTAGGEIVITPPLGVKFDLYDFYVDVETNDDGVVVWYC